LEEEAEGEGKKKRKEGYCQEYKIQYEEKKK